MDDLDLWRYVKALRRRWLLIALSVPVLAAAVILSANAMLKPVYTATARVLIESQQIPDALARSTVTARAAEQLALIEQRIKTRQNLLEIIEEIGPYADMPELSTADQVSRLRGGIAITPITDRTRNQSVQAFTISFSSHSPQMAASVANEVLERIIEQNVRSRSARASETNDFFLQEVDRLSAELLALEAMISAFKNENAMSLPESVDFRRAEMTTLMERMFERDRKLIALEEEKRILEWALQQGRDMQPEVQISQEQRDLQALERELSMKSAIFAPGHPDIRRLTAQVQALRSLVGGSVADGSGGIADFRMTELSGRIERVDRETDLLRRQQQDAEKRVALLEESLGRTPEVEMELNALTRRYENLQVQYRQAVDKQTHAATGEKLEVNRQAERFEVVERAQVPASPSSPDRRRIMLGGVVGSIAAALGVVILVEMLNQSIRTAADMERRLNMRPIVTIPYIETESEIARRRRWRGSLVVLALILVPGALYAVDQFYLPLGVAVDRAIGAVGADGVVARVRQVVGL